MIAKAIKRGLTFDVVMSFLLGCTSASKKQDAPVSTPNEETTSALVEQFKTLCNFVYFDFDQYSLTAESRAVLLAHADKLKGASTSVRLEGHADERGSREYNMALGAKRANAVRDFLVTQGVSGASLDVISFGEEQPA